MELVSISPGVGIRAKPKVKEFLEEMMCSLGAELK